MDWLSEKYPDTFDKYYRPRFEHWREQAAEGQALLQHHAADAVPGLPDPDALHRAGRPDARSATARATTRARSTTSARDGCKDIFDYEPEKYVQAWLPVHQIYQGNCFDPGADPTAPGFNPLVGGARVLPAWTWAATTSTSRAREDQKNFARPGAATTPSRLTAAAATERGRRTMAVACRQASTSASPARTRATSSTAPSCSTSAGTTT